MPDLQEQLNQILSNPDALKQVQSLGEQLGLNTKALQAPQKPQNEPKPQSSNMNADMLNMVTKLAPLMNSFKSDDETTVFLHSLKPFLSAERREKLDKAEKMLKVLKLLPLIKDNGLF